MGIILCLSETVTASSDMVQIYAASITTEYGDCDHTDERSYHEFETISSEQYTQAYDATVRGGHPAGLYKEAHITGH